MQLSGRLEWMQQRYAAAAQAATLAGDSQLAFALQIQEWKNLLLRADAPADRGGYYESSRRHAQLTSAGLRELAALVDAALAQAPQDPVLRARSKQLADLHERIAQVWVAYESAWTQLYDADRPESIHAVDRRVRGVDRSAMALLDKLGSDLLLEAGTEARVLEIEARKALAVYVAGLALVAVVLLGAIAAIVVPTVRRIPAELSRMASTMDDISANLDLKRRLPADSNDEISQIASNVNVLLERLAQAHKELIEREKMAALGALVAGVSHELNTPIGNSLLTTTTLQQRTAQIDEEQRQGLRKSSFEDYLALADDSCELLLRNLQRASDLIQSFKQVAMDQGSQARAVFDLAQVLQRTLQVVDPIYRHRPQRIHLVAPIGISMDSYPGPLEQAIGHLISNAFLHGFEDREEGSLRIEASRSGGTWVQIVVEDDGRGIAAEILPHVFEPFYTTRFGRGGNGLGLSLVHAMVYQVLGGTVSVQSHADRGCRFEIRLPLQAPTTATAMRLHA